MSTEPVGVESDSNADYSAHASRFEYGVAHTSETLTDAVSFQCQDLVVKLNRVKRKARVSARDDNLCNVVDTDADSVDISEISNHGSKLENLDGVVLASSDLVKRNGFANENLKLFDSDLVWAKVRSFPWWPGQVFDSSVASKDAMKHFKKGKGNLLVTYFGDSTFAWNNASQIKPFYQHFSQMQKQSNSSEFRDAIDSVLEEVSRRVEFGLSCFCVSEAAYKKLKTQNIINPGIRKDSRLRYGGDKLSDAMSFKPVKLVAYMKHLACFPSYDATEKLQFVISRAQLLAFQQWKGYSHFLEYETFLRSVESTVPKASLLEPNTDEEMSSKKRKTDYKDNEEHKQRFDFEDRTDEKTQKTLSDFDAKKRSGSRSTERLDGKLYSDKKRKVESSEFGMSEKKIKNNWQKEDSVSKNSDEENNLSVGDANKVQKAAGLCNGTRVGNEMSSLTSTFEPCSDSKYTTKAEVENQEMKKPKHEEVAQRRISSPDEMLSSLHSAKTPNGIPESISIDPLNYEDFEKFINELSCSNPNDDLKKTSISKISEPCDVKDSAQKQTAIKYCSPDSSAPNAIILKFAVSGSLPSEEKLNEIFNRYGPLRESETRVMKKSKRAKVVFKRGKDAKTAFCSSGKDSIFGPSLLSYGLKYVCPEAQESNNMTN